MIGIFIASSLRLGTETPQSFSLGHDNGARVIKTNQGALVKARSTSCHCNAWRLERTLEYRKDGTYTERNESSDFGSRLQGPRVPT